ncbi:MAG: hypothetical protein M1840_008945 [Geoglossum simile]|nr:MAG: hypothetical protein M1840_008945 [Geoglossum simile]
MDPKRKVLRAPSLLDVFFPVPKLKPKKANAVAAAMPTAPPIAQPVAQLVAPPVVPYIAPPAENRAPVAPPPPAPRPVPTEPAAWTDVEDEELMDFKETDTAWKEISVAMERPLYDIKRRYGELRRARAEAEKKPAKGKGKGKGKEKPDEESVRPEERSEGPASAGMTLPFLQADERWSQRELILLLEIAKRYEQTKWLWIASRFYDKTGKRVSAEEVREKLGG